MKTQKTILCACLVVLLVFARSASAVNYNVIDLGTLPGGDGSWAYSLNDNVQIVGGASLASQSHSCLFDPTGGGANIDLGSLGFIESVVCWSNNNNDQIVGQAHLAYGFTNRACLFDPTGGGANINLGILPGYEQSAAYSINNNDQIVGQSENYGPGFASYGHACVFYTTGGSPMDLGALGSSAPYSAAMSINDHDQIVGWASSSVPMAYQACLFDATGGGANIGLGDLGGGWSSASANNNSGQIVGNAYTISGNVRACLFDPTGGGANINLGTLVGYDNTSWAGSINDHGQIVGDASDSSGNSHACLFDPTGEGNNIDLNTLIDPSSGWTLTYASDINNDGWIVGYGINSAGQTHAFRLVPEPATIVLLVTGGLLLLLRSRKRSQTE